MKLISLYICLGYLIFILALGLLAPRKAHGKQGYFLSSGHILPWMAAMSLFATILSPISFLGLPSLFYSGSWLYYYAISQTIFIVLFARLALPRIRESSSLSVYSYLEQRFSRVLRKAASLIFILYSLIRMALVTYLPVLALSSFGKLPSWLSPSMLIMIVGGLCLLYSVVGGFKTIVLIDTVQGITFFAVLALIFVVTIIHLSSFSVSQIWSTLSSSHKLLSASAFHFSLTKPTFWAMQIGIFFISIYSYISQDSMQRLKSAPSLKAAQRSLYITAALSGAFVTLSALLGSLLFALLTLSQGGHTFARPDELIPYFTQNFLPAGFSGLLIAALFAASQSTMSSSLNSSCAALLEDFFPERWTTSLDSVRLICLGLGAVGLLLALAAVNLASTGVFNFSNKVISLFSTPIVSVFLLGIFSRVGKQSAFVAFCFGLAVSYLFSGLSGNLKYFSGLFPYLIAPIGILSSVGVGLLSALLVKEGATKGFKAGEKVC